MKARRLTPHRSAVLETIRASRTHPTAAEIYSQVRRRRPGVAYATIYNALDWLTRNGMVSELRLGDEASRYDPTTARHDHLVCTLCGALVDYKLPLPHRILLQAGRRHGFRVQYYRLELFGCCSQCAPDSAAPSR